MTFDFETKLLLFNYMFKCDLYMCYIILKFIFVAFYLLSDIGNVDCNYQEIFCKLIYG